MGDALGVLDQSVKELLGRASSPLHFRFIMMPVVVTVLAIRAGIRDCKTGRVQFLWLTQPDARTTFPVDVVGHWQDHDRRRLLDTAYQIIDLKTFHPGQMLIVVAACTIVPYVLIRAPVAALTKIVWKNTHRHAPANGRAVGGSGQ